MRRLRLLIPGAFLALAVAGCGDSTATSSAAAPATAPTMSAAQMDAAMAASIKAFPAKTKGTGAQPLQPTILGDGTKKFDITAQIVPWEVSPGKTVQAWTYNGTVPGPTIQVQVNDKVQIVLHNKLPESTSMHIHGVQVPFADDGTADISQPPIKPGEEYTYAFTPTTVAVGMYHSHDNGVTQMPNGLFGPIYVGDMPVPAAGGDVPSNINVTGGNQPFMLDDGGVIGLSFNGKSFPATAPFTAKVDQWMEVTYFNAGQMDHPMHLHEFPQLVIAVDGHPLSTPYYADTLLVGPGQRYTVLINPNLEGTWVWHCHILSHAETMQGMFGMVTALVVTP
jgi:FtsP/CotA-like multicopper oxidase with cupredoxin domain